MGRSLVAARRLPDAVPLEIMVQDLTARLHGRRRCHGSLIYLARKFSHLSAKGPSAVLVSPESVKYLGWQQQR